MSGPHIDALLSDLALGLASSSVTAQAELHLHACARCERELARTREVLAALTLGAAAPVSPAPAGVERLRSAIAAGGRLARFAPRVAELLDLSREAAEAALDGLDRPGAWRALPIPGAEGIAYSPVCAGPGRAGASVGFLRVRAGGRFPEHTHHGRESVLALTGGFRDEATGRQYGPGEVHVMEAGTSHAWVAVDGPDCICLGVVEAGFTVEGARY